MPFELASASAVGVSDGNAPVLAGGGSGGANISGSGCIPPSAPGTAGGAACDPRDARAVSRILMLLTHFGRCGPVARHALTEHRAETLCLSVLAHNQSTLPPMAVTQAIRVLSIMFCTDASEAAEGKSFDEGGALSSTWLATSAPSVPKCRMVSKALSLLLNKVPEDGQLAGPTAMAAALELLLHLSSARSMCLNLLFSAVEESAAEGAPIGWPISVSVSCAFRLAQCAQRLARELSVADERWEVTQRGS